MFWCEEETEERSRTRKGRRVQNVIQANSSAQTHSVTVSLLGIRCRQQ